MFKKKADFSLCRHCARPSRRAFHSHRKWRATTSFSLFSATVSWLLDGQTPSKNKHIWIPCFYFGTGVRWSPVVMPMYQVKPVSPGDIKIDLPTCMYKLPNVHAQGMNCSEHALQVITLTINSPFRRHTPALNHENAYDTQYLCCTRQTGIATLTQYQSVWCNTHMQIWVWLTAAVFCALEWEVGPPNDIFLKLHLPFNTLLLTSD